MDYYGREEIEKRRRESCRAACVERENRWWRSDVADLCVRATLLAFVFLGAFSQAPRPRFMQGYQFSCGRLEMTNNWAEDRRSIPTGGD